MQCTPRLTTKLLFVQMLLTCTSHKKIRRIAEVLKSICQGLTCSRGHRADKTTLMSLSFCSMKPSSQNTSSTTRAGLIDHDESSNMTKADRRPQDCRLIAKAPHRLGAKPKLQESTNQAVVIQFGIQVNIEYYIQYTLFFYL